MMITGVCQVSDDLHTFLYRKDLVIRQTSSSRQPIQLYRCGRLQVHSSAQGVGCKCKVSDSPFVMATSFLSFETRCCSWLFLALKQGVARGFAPIYDVHEHGLGEWRGGDRRPRCHANGKATSAVMGSPNRRRTWGGGSTASAACRMGVGVEGGSCGGRASSGKQAIARSVVLLQMLGVSCQRIRAAAVVVVGLLRSSC